MSESSERTEALAQPDTAANEDARPKKKRKKKAQTGEPREGVPAFALNFPRDAELDALVDAFERGDYGHVRVEGPRLAERTKSASIRRASLELARRTRPDPLAVLMLVAACVLLVFFALWYFTHRLDAH
jgi:hypothetical protein